MSKDFSPERVRQQLEQVSSHVRRTLSGFERRIKREVGTLKQESEKDDDFVETKIDGILLRCDVTVDRYARQDVGKHWKTRRYGNWGSILPDSTTNSRRCISTCRITDPAASQAI